MIDSTQMLLLIILTFKAKYLDFINVLMSTFLTVDQPHSFVTN